MDFLKKAAESVSGGSKNEQTKTDAGASGSSAKQTDDYGDKAFAALSSKTGYNIGRDTQEKITDAGRGAYEKASGQKVPEKYSN
ncbi:hypothetical protein ACHAQA_006177 [Verticillium albo-atrum]